MTIKYRNVAAVSDGTGTWESPYKYWSSYTPSAGDDLRDVGVAWVTPSQTITLTKNSTATISASGHGVLQYDCLKVTVDTVDWYLFVASITNETVTLLVPWHLTTVSGVTFSRVPATTYALTGAQGTPTGAGSDGAPILWSGGWTADGVQGGVTYYRGDGTASRNCLTSCKGIKFNSDFILNNFASPLNLTPICTFADGIKMVIAESSNSVQKTFNGYLYMPELYLVGSAQALAFGGGGYANIKKFTHISSSSILLFSNGTNLSICDCKLYFNGATPQLNSNNYSNITINYLLAIQFGTGATSLRHRTISRIKIKNYISPSVAALVVTGSNVGATGEISFSDSSEVNAGLTEIQSVGSLLKSATDSNFTALNSEPFTQCFFNYGNWSFYNTRNAGCLSENSAVRLNGVSKMWKDAGNYTTYLPINHYITGIDGTKFWMEIVSVEAGELLGSSTTGSIALRSSASDWSVELSANYTLATAQEIEIRIYGAWYDVANRLALGYSAYSPDGGITRIRYHEHWGNGKYELAMAQKTTTADKILSPVKVTNDGQIIEGTLVIPEVPPQRFRPREGLSPSGRRARVA